MSPLLPVHVVSPELQAHLELEKQMLALRDNPATPEEALDAALDKMDVTHRKLSEADIEWLNSRKGVP